MMRHFLAEYDTNKQNESERDLQELLISGICYT